LKNKKVQLKIISGDNALIASAIAAQIGMSSPNIISGKELHTLNDEAIIRKVDETDIFAEIEPSQKERIVRALQKKGHVVGYLGDGINDASALKTADVGISVNTAVDIAKESADMILLEKELIVLSDGITEGRRTYLNTLKYIFITISANFGNMFSMAAASVFLPFLPLLPAQILLTNFLSDIPALAIASDNVDEEMLEKPRRWDVRLIRNFMIVFGLESSLFDLMTFGILLYVFNASAELFHTGWFVESVITEILILLVIRTRRTFTKSKAGKMLMISSVIVILLVLLMPYIPAFTSFGLVPLPMSLLLVIGLIAFTYALFGEVTKKILFRKLNF
jgi:Mg2+-importing ATPase